MHIPHEKNTDEYVKNNRPPGHFIDIGKIYNVSMLKYANNLYTNYLLYGGVETVGLGLTFRGG